MIIWEAEDGGSYRVGQQIQLSSAVWRVRWSVCGDKLVVSLSGDENNEGSLAVLEEQEDGSYEVVQS